MIERLLPPGAVGSELFADPPEDELWADPWPQEQAAVEGAVESRRREFAAGRWCARRALAGLGLPATVLPRGERGMPVWPDGAVGSITHCAGYRAAVVALAGALPGIGIDAEPHAALPGDVLDLVALPAERDRLAEVAAASDRVDRVDRVGNRPLHADLLLFSAKESVYKAWFPLGRRVLTFSHVRVDLDADGGFRAELTGTAPAVPGAPTRFTGHWLVDRGLLLTLALPLP